jgi:hypothetical protein
MGMQHVMVCSCLVETPCEPSDQSLGAVWECPACGEITACVRPKAGDKAWVRVERGAAEFYGLLIDRNAPEGA